MCLTIFDTVHPLLVRRISKIGKKRLLSGIISTEESVLAYNVTDGTVSVPFVIQEHVLSYRQHQARTGVCFCAFSGLVMHK